MVAGVRSMKAPPSAKPKAAPKAKAKAAGGHGSSKTADGGWVFSDVHKADAAYIMKELHNNAVLVPFLASMMRDQTLQGLLTKHLQGAQPAALGKVIVAKAKVFRHLPQRVWQIVWENMWSTPPEEKPGQKMSIEDHHELAEAMFGISMDAWLPKEHKCCKYEGPLIALLKVRHEEIGTPCSSLTWTTYVAGDWGRFRIAKPFDGNITVDDNDAVLITTALMAQAADDWVVSYPNSLHCTLSSAKLHFSQGVLPLVMVELPDFKIEELLMACERKHAADKFPDEKKYQAVAAQVVEENAINDDGSVTFEGVVVTPAKKRRSVSGAASASPN